MTYWVLPTPLMYMSLTVLGLTTSVYICEAEQLLASVTVTVKGRLLDVVFGKVPAAPESVAVVADGVKVRPAGGVAGLIVEVKGAVPAAAVKTWVKPLWKRG